MADQKQLMALTVAICVFVAVGTALSIVVTPDDQLASILIASGLSLLPLAATFWLSRHLQRPFVGRDMPNSYME